MINIAHTNNTIFLKETCKKYMTKLSFNLTNVYTCSSLKNHKDNNINQPFIKLQLNKAQQIQRKIIAINQKNKSYFSQFNYKKSLYNNKNQQFTQSQSLNKNTKNKQKFRDQFINDYLYFKSMPADMRSQQLQRIIMMPPSQQQFTQKFKENQKHKQQWYEYNGVKLKSYIWQPKQNQYPKAVVVCYHSLNSHSLIYSEMAQRLTRKGYVVAAVDYPNFGKSEGDKRGNISSFSDIAEPSEKYFYHVKKMYPNTKIYMLGTSLGGAVAFCLANRFTNKQLNGLIMLSPAIRQNSFHKPLLKKLGAFLAVTFPNFRLYKIKTRHGSKYKLDQYLQSDPYIYKEGMWTCTMWTVLATMLNFAKQFKYLQKPYLVVQSGMDKMIDPFLAIDLQRMSPSKDKTTVIIHDMWHNVWFDKRRQDVMKIVEEWLEQRNYM